MLKGWEGGTQLEVVSTVWALTALLRVKAENTKTGAKQDV
jgi:hypothetical protein